MMKNLIFLFCFLFTVIAFSQEQFRRDYNVVSVFDFQTNSWGEWKEGYNTFVFNYNENGDVLHIRANGNRVIYRKLSAIYEDQTDEGEQYQIMDVLGEEGESIRLQLFDNSNIGLKLMWENFMAQFVYN